MVYEVIQTPGDYQPSAGKKLTLKISGLNTPRTNEPTDSFEVTTFNKINNFNFFIDGAKSGLIIESECSYPCKTCLESDPEHCTSCFELRNQQIGLPYLQLNTCVAECNFGRYYDAAESECLECSDDCHTCEGSADNCLTCTKGQLPFFHENECLAVCPDGYLGNAKANEC
jgi:hypothetical protein